MRLSETQIENFHERGYLFLPATFDREEVDVFLSGLAGLDEQARTRFGTSFNEASPDQHRTLVQDLDDELDAMRSSDPAAAGDTFFHTMKRLTIAGYFTSEDGAIAVGYRTLPGQFEGCTVGGPA